jgi:uracil-DNA glycosylase
MWHVMASADDRPNDTPRSGGAKSPPTQDEIQERYLKRAIGEINELGDELLALGDERHVPVLGSGHPLGDVFLLKHRPTQSEIHEGVAFFGRAGQALLKSLQRLSVDPLAVYGTNCLKFGTEDASQARAWLTRELHIVQPRLVVAMARRRSRSSTGSSSRSRRRSPQNRWASSNASPP